MDNNNNKFSYSTNSSVPFDNFARKKYFQPISMTFNNLSHYGENENIQNGSHINNNNSNSNNNQNNNSSSSNYGNSNSQSSHIKNSTKYLFPTVPPGRGVFPIPFSLR